MLSRIFSIAVRGKHETRERSSFFCCFYLVYFSIRVGNFPSEREKTPHLCLNFASQGSSFLVQIQLLNPWLRSVLYFGTLRSPAGAVPEGVGQFTGFFLGRDGFSNCVGGTHTAYSCTRLDYVSATCQIRTQPNPVGHIVKTILPALLHERIEQHEACTRYVSFDPVAFSQLLNSA